MLGQQIGPALLGRHDRHDLVQGPLLLARPLGRLVHEVVGVLAAHRRGELDHHRLGHDESAVEVEVGGHPLRVDPHALGDDEGLAEGRAGQAAQVRDEVPLGLPLAGGPFVAGLLDADQSRGQRAGDGADADHELRADRVDLLRHRGRGAPVAGEGLEDLADLGARQVDDVAPELRAGAGDRGADPAVLGQDVAVDVPGHGHVRETELGGQPGPDPDGAGPLGGVRAAGAEERHDGDPLVGLLQTRALAAHLVEQSGQCRAEGGRHGLLGVRAAGHHGAGVLGGALGQGVAEALEPLVQGLQGAGHLERQCGVHDVLGGRAVVDAPVGAGGAVGGDLPDQPEDRVADVLRVPPQPVAVDVPDPCGADDGLGVRGPDDAQRGLRRGQRPFDAQPRLDAGVLAEEFGLDRVACVPPEKGEGGCV